MRESVQKFGRERAKKVAFACTITMAMLLASLVSVSVITDTASARGPAYNGPTTQAVGPAYFGPAPNPFPYCDSPTYLDPFPENIAPIGRMDVGSTASVTTDGITMDLVITAEGNPGTQYPGFFPNGGEGAAGDQAKGIEMAEGDAAGITLSEPLFYSQWIFTDVDQPDEGFNVNPRWTEVGEAAAFGGDNNFTFAGSTVDSVELDDTDGQSTPSESINGRVQVDFLGAVTGIDITRTDPSNGQSGFAVGGGCEATGTAKVLTAGPTWNGTSFDVTYELRLRNNLPSSATIQQVINEAQAAVGASFVTDTPQGIVLSDLQLTDTLTDPAFSTITVTSLSTDGGLDLNETFDGQTDIELLDAGSTIAAEQTETITLSVAYTPDLAQATWANCANGYDYLNQSFISGNAANVAVTDASDDGVNPAPSNNNGAGGVDDPTPVLFPCLPGALDIVKTVVAGPNGTCPTFDLGVRGDGAALAVTEGDIVTYCVSVQNPGVSTANDVVISDPQAPGDFAIGTLTAGATATRSYDVVVDDTTPTRNIATATGTDALGALDPVSDPAVITVSPRPQPNLEIVKTAVVGPNGTCPSFAGGTPGLGDAVSIQDGGTVTYCVSVRNSGLGDATNVVVSDPQAPASVTIGTLVAGAEAAAISYDIEVDDTTPTSNTATVNGNGPDGALAPASDPAQIVVTAKPQPKLEIVKTAVAGPNGTCPSFTGGTPGVGAALPVDEGGTVTYCVSVRNTGPGDATNVVVSDPQAPAPVTIGALAAGAEATAISYDVAVNANTPVDNTATVNGNGPDGALTPVSDPAQISITPPPALEIVKTAVVGPNGTCPSFDNGTPGLGDAVEFLETETVTYCVSVRNSGSATATDVVISDPQAPNTFDLTVGTLAPGAEATRQYDLVVDSNTPTSNTATVNGNGPTGSLPPKSDPAQIAVSPQPDPVLEIVKTVVLGPNGTCPNFDGGIPGDGPALPVLEGQTVTFCISVRNTSGNPATSVSVSDPQAPGVFQIGTLPVGQEQTRSYDVLVTSTTPASNINTATVSGNGPNGALPEKSDTAVIDPSPQPDPVLAIVKTVVPGPNGACPSFADGVVGDGPALPVQYTETVTYCISIKNVGGNAATAVRIDDPQAPGVFAIGTLAVNQERNRSYDIVVNASTADTNTATVSGVGPNGPVPSASDTAIIAPSPLPDPVLEIVKTVVAGPNGSCPDFANGVQGRGDALATQIGDTVTYCISIRNSGQGAANSVVITDAQAPKSPYTIGDLAVGAETSVSYDIVIDENTPFINVAVVSGRGPNPNSTIPEANDDAEIDVTDNRLAQVSLIHSVSKADDECLTVAKDRNSLAADVAGTEVTWCVKITNTGNVPLTNVVLNAPAIGVNAVDALEAAEAGTVLQRGESVFLSVGGLVIPESGLVSTGTVVADPSDADGNLISLDPVTDTDDAQVREAAIDLQTTVVAGADGDCADATERITVPVGADVTWCFTVTNTGTVPLQVTEVNDVTLGITVPIPEEDQVLLPGESVTVKTSSVAAPGDLTNDAEVVGQPLDTDGSILNQAPVVEDDDPAGIDTPEADLAIVKSVSDPGPVAAGTELTYTLVITNNGPDAASGVTVDDVLPTGLSYATLPGDADWVCALGADARTFSCLKATPMQSGESVTLTYTVDVDVTAASGSTFLNTATVDSDTPDTDDSNNTDTAITRTPPFTPVTTPLTPEYPGPFTPPAPPLAIEPDEVLGLAITGTSSSLLGLVSTAMLALGGLLTVGARRSRREGDQ